MPTVDNSGPHRPKGTMRVGVTPNHSFNSPTHLLGDVLTILVHTSFGEVCILVALVYIVLQEDEKNSTESKSL